MYLSVLEVCMAPGLERNLYSALQNEVKFSNKLGQQNKKSFLNKPGWADKKFKQTD